MASGIVDSVRAAIAGPEASSARPMALLRSERWDCAVAATAREALRAVRDEPSLDLLVLAPGEALDPWLEVCRSVKFDQRTRHLWVVFLLPACHCGRGGDVMDAGADECIREVASDREMTLRLLKAATLKRATESLDDAQTVITALASAVEGKDHYTCGHVERVGAYAVAIGRRLGLDDRSMSALKTGGIVHDIGKIGIPDQILNKPGRLTDDEMAIMRRHPLIGHDILKPLRTFHDVVPIVRWHHERPNGTGYPDAIAGDALPLLPRIIAVTDVFDALITDRPYRKGFPVEQCRKIMLEGGAKGELDPSLVGVLMQILDEGAIQQAA